MRGLVCDWAAPKSKLGSLPCTVCSTHVLLVNMPEELFPPNSSLYRKKNQHINFGSGKEEGGLMAFFFFPSWVDRASWITNEDSYTPKKHWKGSYFYHLVLLFQTLQQQFMRLDWVLSRERKDWVSKWESWLHAVKGVWIFKIFVSYAQELLLCLVSWDERRVLAHAVSMCVPLPYVF